jgi:hypothetical protein
MHHTIIDFGYLTFFSFPKYSEDLVIDFDVLHSQRIKFKILVTTHFLNTRTPSYLLKFIYVSSNLHTTHDLVEVI